GAELAVLDVEDVQAERALDRLAVLALAQRERDLLELGPHLTALQRAEHAALARVGAFGHVARDLREGLALLQTLVGALRLLAELLDRRLPALLRDREEDVPHGDGVGLGELFLVLVVVLLDL